MVWAGASLTGAHPDWSAINGRLQLSLSIPWYLTEPVLRIIVKPI